jgi:hypothetical protein
MRRSVTDEQMVSSSAGARAEKILVPEDVCFERSDDQAIQYKRKLRIVLRNESEKHIIVRSPSWRRRSNLDIQVRPQDRYLWQTEGPNGWENGSWGPNEMAEVPAGPGAILRTWIGLHDDATRDGVRRRLVQGNLGILVVPLIIDGQLTEQRLTLGPIRT